MAEAGSCRVETALAECEFLIRLMDGPCENASQVAGRHFNRYQRVEKVLLQYLGLRKVLTRDAGYGETYLAYLEKLDKTDDESRKLIREIRRVGDIDAATE